MSAEFWDTVNGRIREVLGNAFIGEPQGGVGGGCISAAECLVDRRDGRRVFVKSNNASMLAMFEAEARGLEAMAATDTILTPRPLCWGSAHGRAFLALEWLEIGGRGSYAEMGEQLAAMHLSDVAGDYGWEWDNHIGATPQSNRAHDSWIQFYINERLDPQVRMAEAKGASLPVYPKLRALVPQLLADACARPMLVHGDLWSGNAGFTADGRPVIFDPAVYRGHGEVDLAMSELFGGFTRHFYSAYRAVIPTDGYGPHRRKLYNLYHVLNHYNLFGGYYLSQAKGMMRDLVDI